MLCSAAIAVSTSAGVVLAGGARGGVERRPEPVVLDAVVVVQAVREQLPALVEGGPGGAVRDRGAGRRPRRSSPGRGGTLGAPRTSWSGRAGRPGQRPGPAAAPAPGERSSGSRTESAVIVVSFLVRGSDTTRRRPVWRSSGRRLEIRTRSARRCPFSQAATGPRPHAAHRSSASSACRAAVANSPVAAAASARKALTGSERDAAAGGCDVVGVGRHPRIRLGGEGGQAQHERGLRGDRQPEELEEVLGRERQGRAAPARHGRGRVPRRGRAGARSGCRSGCSARERPSGAGAPGRLVPARAGRRRGAHQRFGAVRHGSALREVGGRRGQVLRLGEPPLHRQPGRLQRAEHRQRVRQPQPLRQAPTARRPPPSPRPGRTPRRVGTEHERRGEPCVVPDRAGCVHRLGRPRQPVARVPRPPARDGRGLVGAADQDRVAEPAGDRESLLDERVAQRPAARRVLQLGGPGERARQRSGLSTPPSRSSTSCNVPVATISTRGRRGVRPSFGTAGG